MRALTQEEIKALDGRITPFAPYGQHINVTCKHHPHLNWSTKNIECIGSRSVFYYNLKEAECKCSIRDMVPVIPEVPTIVPA